MASGMGKDELMIQCRRYFKTIDTNGDGKLNRVEFQNMCSELICSADVTGLEGAYKKADKNGDGVVSFVEFMDAYANSQEDVKTANAVKLRQKICSGDTDDLTNQIRQYFREIDSDGSGKLDPNEFSKMLRKLGVELDQNELMKIYKKADSNGDGEVSFREFLSSFAVERRKEQRRRSRRVASIVHS